MENEMCGNAARIEEMHSEVRLKIPFGRAGHRLNDIRIKET
jgi:hypothetical protein